jgi:hypothetical protein
MPIILEDAKFLWTKAEIETCIALYQLGNNAYEIAEQMKERPDDIALLIIHLGQKNKLNSLNRRLLSKIAKNGY